MNKIIAVKETVKEDGLTLDYLKEFLLTQGYESRLFIFKDEESRYCLWLIGLGVDRKFYGKTKKELCKKIIRNLDDRSKWVQFIKRRFGF